MDTREDRAFASLSVMPTPVSRTGGATPAAPAATTTPVALKNDRFVADPQLKKVLSGELKLGAGSRGDGLKKVQQSLSDMGFAVAKSADGAYGPQTKKAITNFQVNASKAFPKVKVTGELDAETLKALDKLAPKSGQLGQNGNIPTPFFNGKPVRVVVVKDEHRTFVFDKNGKLERIFQNAVGASATSTDEGLKVVASKLGQAESYALGDQLWGGHVFGPRILNLSWADGRSSGEELHGTSAPTQLGEDVSHGCVRHSNPDIILMTQMINNGDKVAVVGSFNDKRLKR